MEVVDKRLDEKTLKKLKASGMLGFEVEASFKYVPKFYRDPENSIPKEYWPLYVLKSKDGLAIAETEDNMSVTLDRKEEARSFTLKTGSVRISTLKNGIVSIKNQKTEDGRVLSYDVKTKKLIVGSSERECDTEEAIRYMTANLQVDLQNAINERISLTEEELVGLGF